MNHEKQPEALQLAQFFESMKKSSHRWHDRMPIHEKTSAELRRLHSRVQELEAELVKEAARTAEEKLRADQMSQQHSTQAALNSEARKELAEMKAQQAVQPAAPVGGQSRFKGEKDWQWCAAEHVAMVLATPSEWQGYEVRYVYAHTAEGVPKKTKALIGRAVQDSIRGAYDLGYSDARNAKAVPGDSAPGYQGRNVEADHGGALLHRLAQLSASTQPAAQWLDAKHVEAVLLEHSGCGHNTQVDQLTVRLNPGDKVVLRKGRITQGYEKANAALAAQAKQGG